ncbi:MAG: long-chain fatty acid--CoA ligase [Planctomycetes bacterium]|nr:long-chain fatty acid--CoA ligase [Planctomycetota bacterium]
MTSLDLSRVHAEPAAERLAVAIDETARQDASRLAVVADAGGPSRRAVAYADLAKSISAVEAALAAARPAGVVVRARRVESLVAVAAACGRQGVPVALVPDDARDLVGELRDWLVVDDSLAVSAGGRQRDALYSGPPHVVVATSGTSGPPKLVQRTWDAVLSAARLAEQWQGLGWLLAYDATRWAGIQVWGQSLLTGGRLVVPASRDPDVVARALVEERVAILPATPTLLRRLLASADPGLLAAAKPERITLGGEAADGPLLAKARDMFPAARITHVYATTELGEVFRVADGQPGFPAAWLGRELPGGVRISTRRDGELLVQLSRDSAEVATGDVVERRGDRFEFTGRRSDVIVVGGAKVFPKRVEEVLRGVSGVVEARVYGQPSAITGELVAAEIVLADPLPAGSTPEGIRAAALAACRDSLEPHGVPRILDLVKRITTTSAGKTSRRPAVVR